MYITFFMCSKINKDTWLRASRYLIVYVLTKTS